jgi:hypothetical protein
MDSVWVTFEDKVGNWTSEALRYNGDSGLWEGTIAGSTGEFSYFVQAIDKAGNISTISNKGAYLRAEPDKTYLPIVQRNAP